MATVLCLTSIEPAGKTALGVAIGKDLLKRGRKVGYFVPVVLQQEAGKNHGKDTAFIKEILELKEDNKTISPMHYAPMDLWNNLSTDTSEFDHNLKSAFQVISKNKDVVIVESLSGLVKDATATLSCYRISEQLGAKVIILLRYSDDLKPDILSRVKAELKDNLLGVVINYVPESKMDYIRDNMTSSFEAEGMKVLGLIPESRTLVGVTVEEIVNGLHGQVLTAGDKLNDLVENVMLGAMTPDSGISYFSRKPNKAVIVNSERADMQLAALETSTSCLILTGPVPPLEQVIHHSEIRNIPIISVKSDSLEVIDEMENIFAANVFNNPKKLKRFQQITASNVDYNALYTAAGMVN
jgi:BioD-like phosphotransacetylase family protein